MFSRSSWIRNVELMVCKKHDRESRVGEYLILIQLTKLEGG
jgi:hypothetical protein